MIEFDSYEEAWTYLSVYNNTHYAPAHITIIHYEYKWIVIINDPFQDERR